ncbi:MAG: SDR family oxidoreductase [Flavobacteriales bacterium]
MKVLVIGGDSFIAKGIESYLSTQDITLVRVTRMQLDITNEVNIRTFCNDPGLPVFDAVLFAQGINPSLSTKETSFEHLSKMLAVNISGPVLLLKHLMPRLHPSANVIFLSSVAAEKGSYDPGYAASKAAIQGLINSFANEFQSMRFNAIALGLVENSPVFNQMTPDFLQKHRDRMFQGSLIQLEHIASIVKVLLTNENLNRSIIPLTSGFR